MKGDDGGAVEISDEEMDDNEKAAAIIERTTAAASEAMVDGGALVALGKLKELVDLQASEAVESPTDHWVAADARSDTTMAPSSWIAPGDHGDHPLEAARGLVTASSRKRPAGPMETSEGMDFEADEVIEDMVARVRPGTPGTLKMPWEIGFVGLVLGEGNPFLNLGSSMQALSPKGMVPEIEEIEGNQQQETQVEEKDNVLMKLFGGTKRRPMKVEEKERRDKVKEHWLVIIRVMGKATPIFNMVEEDGEEIQGPWKSGQVL